MLKKHHFWVLCSLAALVGFICWWMGTNSVANETKSNEGVVKQADSSLSGVDKEARPPNGSFATGVSARDDELKQKVLVEWKQRYDEQQKLFEWPADVAEDMARLKHDSPIGDNVRRLYKQLVFPKVLYDKVYQTADYRRAVAQPDDVEPAAEGAEGEAKPAGGEVAVARLGVDPNAQPVEELEGLVVWNPAHCAVLEQRYNLKANPATPTTLSIRLAQEDVWVLENLAQVIRQTNEGAQDIIAAPIKRIDSLEIAQWAINDAVAASPKVYVDKSSTEAEAAVGGMGAGAAAAAEVSAEATQEEREKAADDELLNGRYIGDTGVPLMAAEQPYAEFRLMFVRMKVVIDQRKIPHLLVNCANAPIPIEVVRCTMLEPLVSPGGVAGNNAAAPAGGGLRGFGAGQNQQPVMQNAAKADSADIEANPQDVTFEVCGLVQLYNPPDETKLGSGTAAEPGKRPNGVPIAAVKPPRMSSGTTSTMGGGLGGVAAQLSYYLIVRRPSFGRPQRKSCSRPRQRNL